MTTILLSAVLGFAVISCAPTALAVKEAREARYDAAYETVWASALQVARDHYDDRIALADADRGVIVTAWRRASMSQERVVAAKMSNGTVLVDDNKSSATTGGPAVKWTTDSMPGQEPGAIFVRAKIRLRGGAPWAIEIEAEAAEYRPGFASLFPFKPGSPEEPAFVKGHADRLSLGPRRRRGWVAMTSTSGCSNTRSTPADRTPVSPPVPPKPFH